MLLLIQVCFLRFHPCAGSSYNNDNPNWASKDYDYRSRDPRGSSSENQRESPANDRQRRREEEWWKTSPQDENWSRRPLADAKDDHRGEPPPPPPEYTPIHYQFQAKQNLESQQPPPERGEQRRRGPRPAEFDKDDLPETHVEDEQIPLDLDETEAPAYASARTDAVTRYMAARPRRLLLRLSAGTVGAALGGFLGKSLTNTPVSLSLACFLLFVISTFGRNPYGELTRALGLALIWALQRTTRIRRQYPTWIHAKSSLGIAPRRRFPPRTDNPWRYEGDDFRMLYATIAMAFVGSACGGNLPLVPTWMGALAGAGCFGFITTVQSARVRLNHLLYCV